MSNPLAPPESGRVEQLNAVELTDELSKNGRSLKGRIKELVGRLKEDEQGGFYDRKEGIVALDINIADEHEQPEVREELLKREKEEISSISNSSKVQETAHLLSNNTLPDVSGFSCKATTLLHELQKPHAASDPGGVPGTSDCREESCTAGNVETSTDVLFVNNAVHENGNAGLECENTTVCILNNKSESEILEKLPKNVTPDLKVEKNDFKETSSRIVVQLEELGIHVECSKAEHESNGSAADQQSNSELRPQLAVQNSMQPSVTFAACADTLVKEIVDESMRGFVTAEVNKQVAEYVNTMPTYEKPTFKSEDAGNFEAFDVTTAGKPVVKTVLMERTAEVDSKDGHEQNIFEMDSGHQRGMLDAAQMKVEQLGPSTYDNSCGEHNGNEVAGATGGDACEIVASMQAEDGVQNHGPVKRDIEPKQQEPAKRMRRWGSGNGAAVSTLEPLTTGAVKKMMLPEGIDSSTGVSQRFSPKVIATTRSLPPIVKAESETNGNIRIVPPSTRAPTNSLKIERFVRPFTLKAVKDMLAEYGEPTDFWMDQIKTHCFVSYSSVNEAVAARNGLYGRQWPPSVGNFLSADYVDSMDVKRRVAGLPEKAEAPPVAPPSSTPHVGRAPFQVSHPPSSFRSDFMSSQMPSFSRGTHYPPAPREPTAPTLDDLFFKTKSKPHIYYLPLTKEQVAEKSRIKQGFN